MSGDGYRNSGENRVHKEGGRLQLLRALCKTTAVMLNVTKDWKLVTCLRCLRKR